MVSGSSGRPTTATQSGVFSMSVEGVDVEAINLGQRKALLNNGAVVAITQFFDSCGDETDCPSEAMAFACSYGGKYYAGSVLEFSGTRH